MLLPNPPTTPQLATPSNPPNPQQQLLPHVGRNSQRSLLNFHNNCASTPEEQVPALQLDLAALLPWSDKLTARSTLLTALLVRTIIYD